MLIVEFQRFWASALSDPSDERKSLSAKEADGADADIPLANGEDADVW